MLKPYVLAWHVLAFGLAYSSAAWHSRSKVIWLGVAVYECQIGLAKAAGKGGASNSLSKVSDGQAVTRSSARGRFSKCRTFPGKRVILVTVNYAFLDFFRNWLQHAGRFLSSSEELLVVAEDPSAKLALSKMAIAAKQEGRQSFTVRDGSGRVASDFLPYGSAEYGRIARERPAYMLRLLKARCSILFSDVDNVWLKSPFADIDRHSGKKRALKPKALGAG